MATRAGRPLLARSEKVLVQTASVPALSHLMGWLCDRRVPQPLLKVVIERFSQAYHVDLTEVAEPLSAFDTFNAFFTRQLKPNARPVDEDPAVVVSPVDAKLQTLCRIPRSGQVEQVKGKRYSVAALLGDYADASPYRDGSLATLYLSPRDYHRVHCPVDGKITSWRYIPGRSFPVNRLAVDHIEGLFTVNERVVIHLETEKHGNLVVVMVGAANVARITLPFDDVTPYRHRKTTTRVEPAMPLSVKRGDELGIFNLGSTVVLLASSPDLLANKVIEGERIRMGQALWRAPEKQA